MRKVQKRQAEEFVESLGQAHKAVKKAIESSNPKLAMDLLEQCQEGAIELGNLLEAEEGEGLPTVRLLEDYCERVYHLHAKLGQALFVDGWKEYKVLQKSITAIESSVRNDIPLRTEVVFLPYKASMWDSLESVWKAAEDDPDCDAYVIPIPYYDKNPDESFGELHYEGREYPKDVPVVWYEDYDFEMRRPDRIYIHNPYDECSFVTSVLPFFYSANLKKYTEQLVYVPYFVLGEIDPGDCAAVDEIKNFCLAPGVFHADKVIVQSESMRQAYIRVLTEETAKNENYSRQNEVRRYWEDKIDGSGSPKFDKVLNTRREGLEIPQEWIDVIEKPDGSRKKIVFYNNGLSAVLRYSENYLAKMQDVLRVFYENRDEIALLWRPHPLLEATIKCMRSELWEKYEEIVCRYQQEGWGIYDDTADIDRAVMLCDAYYGDPSSVVQLCQKVEKPILIQNVELI